VFAALDALKHAERTVGLHGELIDALELVDDAEALADHLHGGAGAARGGFPAAEDEQTRFVEAGDALDGLGERGGNFGRLGETARGTVERDELETAPFARRSS